MKICLVAGKRTEELFSYLQTNFRGQADVTVWFPKEEMSLDDTDLLILDQKKPLLTEAVLDMPSPPLIVVATEGISTDHICYLPDFKAQFPKLVASRKEKEPLLIFLLKNETYLYRQKDIVCIADDGCLTLHLRSGNKAVTTEGIRKVFKRLCPELFFAVGKKAMVNAEYVSRFCAEGVLLQNGMLIACSQEELRNAENSFFKTKFQGISPKK